MAMSSFALTQPGSVRLYSTQELLKLRPPDWLVDGMIPEDGLIGLYGAPESTKSFAAIDLALCVATGLPFHGKTVKKGLALYVAAEGGTGISKRVRAWLQFHNIRPTDADVAWLIESISVYVDSDDLERLMGRLDHEMGRTPSIIIIDTLARCLDGDENQQEDMGRFIAGMDKLRHEYEAAVIAIHHTRLDGDRERGSTAFRGGLDTVMMMTRAKNRIGPVTLSCEKQKDAEHFEDMKFKLHPIEDVDSCVLIDYTAGTPLEERRQRVLNCIATTPLSWDAWLEVSKLSKTTFYRIFKELEESGEIIKENDLWSRVRRNPKQA